MQICVYAVKSRYGIVERIVKPRFTLRLWRKTRIKCSLLLMFSKRFLYWKKRFTVTWTRVCESQLYLIYVVTRSAVDDTTT